MAFQAFDGFFVVRCDADTEDTFGLTSPHRQQTVGRTAFQRFLPVEVVAVFCSLVCIGFSLNYLRDDESLTGEGVSELLTAALVFADGLGDDVLRSLDGSLRIFHVAFDIFLCDALRIPFSLKQEDLGQRLQSLLSGHLGSRPSLGLVWQIDVFQFRCIPAGLDALLQLGRHLFKVGNGLDNRFLTFLYLFEFVESVADGGYLHLVETSRPFFPVT